MAGSQAECDSGMIGEVAHQLEMACIKGALALIPSHGEDSQDGLLRTQGHHDRRPLSDIGKGLNGMAKRLCDHRGSPGGNPSPFVGVPTGTSRPPTSSANSPTAVDTTRNSTSSAGTSV